MDVRKENSHRAPDVNAKQGSENNSHIISLLRVPVSLKDHTLFPHTRINETVTSVQVLKYSLERIEKLLRSVRGITEQLEQEITPQRRKALEDELREVVGAVREVRDNSSVIEVEELKKRAISNIPEELNHMPHMLNNLDNIIEGESRASSLQVSEKELDNLRLAVEEVEASLRVLFGHSETAIENQVAVKSTLNDLEMAIISTQRLADFVLKHPKQCMKVSGKDLQDIVLTSLL